MIGGDDNQDDPTGHFKSHMGYIKSGSRNS